MAITAHRPGAGLTRLIGFSAAWHDRELPAVRSVPHYDDPGAGYDGRFYAQLAVDPLVRDPALDRALDTPILRAHRILLSWTAWIVGLGRPAWIVHVYSVQNLVAWVLLAWLLRRWIQVVSSKTYVLWCGCLLTYGALASIRYSLTDLPATVLVAGSLVLLERNQRVGAAVLAGAAGLARETTLAMCAAFIDVRERRAFWKQTVLAGGLAVAPLASWYAYLAATHDWRMVAGAGNLGMPFVGLWWKVRSIASAVAGGQLDGVLVATIAGLIGFITQGCVVARELAFARPLRPWMAVAAAFLAAVLCLQIAPWDESPGAYLRIALPLTIGVNVALAARPAASWWTIGLANLGVVPSLLLRF